MVVECAFELPPLCHIFLHTVGGGGRPGLLQLLLQYLVASDVAALVDLPLAYLLSEGLHFGGYHLY